MGVEGLQQGQLTVFFGPNVVLDGQQDSPTRTKQQKPCGIDTTMIKMSRMMVPNLITLS